MAGMDDIRNAIFVDFPFAFHPSLLLTQFSHSAGTAQPDCLVNRMCLGDVHFPRPDKSSVMISPQRCLALLHFHQLKADRSERLARSPCRWPSLTSPAAGFSG